MSKHEFGGFGAIYSHLVCDDCPTYLLMALRISDWHKRDARMRHNEHYANGWCDLYLCAAVKAKQLLQRRYKYLDTNVVAGAGHYCSTNIETMGKGG